MPAVIDITKVCLTFLFRITFIIFFLAPVSETTAQLTNNGNDDVYGFDPMLYNGRYYTFFSPLNARGNQYLNDRQFESGTVTLYGRTYSDLSLNYDIYNQQLLMKYAEDNGITKVIIISDAWLESFSINDKNFRILQVSENEKRICQKIGMGPTCILYFWRKSMQVTNVVDGTVMSFSKPSREMNLLTKGKIVRYRNNRSFINLFESEDKENIRKYFRTHRINVKKSSDRIMEDLITYCNTFNDK
jgi:hypothetical protein